MDALPDDQPPEPAADRARGTTARCKQRGENQHRASVARLNESLGGKLQYPTGGLELVCHAALGGAHLAGDHVVLLDAASAAQPTFSVHRAALCSERVPAGMNASHACVDERTVVMKWRVVVARCACGCDRPVQLRDLRPNARLRSARAIIEDMETLAFASSEDEYDRAFLFEGVSWRNQYMRVVHGELTSGQIRSDVAWKAWRSGARAAVREGRRERRKNK